MILNGASNEKLNTGSKAFWSSYRLNKDVHYGSMMFIYKLYKLFIGTSSLDSYWHRRGLGTSFLQLLIWFIHNDSLKLFLSTYWSCLCWLKLWPEWFYKTIEFFPIKWNYHRGNTELTLTDPSPNPNPPDIFIVFKCPYACCLLLKETFRITW